MWLTTLCRTLCWGKQNYTVPVCPLNVLCFTSLIASIESMHWQWKCACIQSIMHAVLYWTQPQSFAPLHQDESQTLAGSMFQGQTLCSLSQGTEISLIQHCTVVLTCITVGITVRVTGKVVYLQYQHQQRLSSAVASTCTTKDITVRKTCKNVCATNRGCPGAAVLTGYAICATVANVHVISVQLCYLPLLFVWSGHYSEDDL